MLIENAAFKLIDSILKFINEKIHVGRIFCNLVKAFASVNHEILLTKLQFYGIQRVKQIVSDPT
jgi:hypothetical protein